MSMSKSLNQSLNLHFAGMKTVNEVENGDDADTGFDE